MKLRNRILHILIAAGLIFVSVLLILLSVEGTKLIALIMGFSLLIYGIRSLVAFFIKFRYIVGGRMQLYIGIIVMDLGLLIISSFGSANFKGSNYLILIYLLGFRLVTGGIGVARAIEAKKNGAPWKIRLAAGIVSLATVLLGIIFFTDPESVVDIYVLGLLFSAVEHFIAAFRREKVVSIA
jgi:uncharacterized membrane protein HdeD (DUF308 family)